jgi:hypothetical protein
VIRPPHFPPKGWPTTLAKLWEATPKGWLEVAEATPIALGGGSATMGVTLATPWGQTKKKKKIKFMFRLGVAKSPPTDLGGRGWFRHPQRTIWGWPKPPLGHQGVVPLRTQGEGGGLATSKEPFGGGQSRP